MLLAECREEVEAGRTAKLVQPARYFDITIRIVKQSGFIWQRATIDYPKLKYYARANSAGYPNWESMMQDIRGEQTETDQWIICDDPIERIM